MVAADAAANTIGKTGSSSLFLFGRRLDVELPAEFDGRLVDRQSEQRGCQVELVALGAAPETLKRIALQTDGKAATAGVGRFVDGAGTAPLGAAHGQRLVADQAEDLFDGRLAADLLKINEIVVTLVHGHHPGTVLRLVRLLKTDRRRHVRLDYRLDPQSISPSPLRLRRGVRWADLDMELTTNQLALLDGLCLRVRVGTFRQAAAIWYGGDWDSCRDELAELAAAGWIRREMRLVKTGLQASEPIVTCEPGRNAVDARAVSYRLKKRWEPLRVMEAELVLAADRTPLLVGGQCVTPRASEFNHDLHVTDVYGRHRGELLASGRQWVSGDSIRTTRQFDLGDLIPDAVIVDATGAIETIVEGGGAYPATKVAEIVHAYRDFRLEIW